MDIAGIVTELKKERARLDRAIAALDGGAPHSNGTATVVHKRRGSRLTPAGRKRLSEMMKKRWAERRKKS
jgi:hypothetical protein